MDDGHILAYRDGMMAMELILHLEGSFLLLIAAFYPWSRTTYFEGDLARVHDSRYTIASALRMKHGKIKHALKHCDEVEL